MSWQSWAANELNQAATYPSPYANVHKGNMNTMGGSIGVGKDDTWKPYTMEMRTFNTEKINNFIASLPQNLSEKNKNSRKLQFMAENGIRQFGLSRIGHLADKLRPEPMHCEINAWQHYIDLLYLEAVRRGIGLYISHFLPTAADDFCASAHQHRPISSVTSHHVTL